MDRYFVLDTNVLLYDPTAIFSFGKNVVYIPLICVEELDRFKKFLNENGRNARQFSRIVDELRKKGSLSAGVDLDNGGKLIIGVDKGIKGKYDNVIDITKNDNLILSSAISLKEDGKDVDLITKDINLRIKADALGITAEDYGKESKTLDELYAGYHQYEVSIERLRSFEQERFLPLDEEEISNFNPNEYLIVCEKGNDRYRFLGRYCSEKKGIVQLIKKRDGVWGIYPKNMQQQFALDALLNDDIKLVTLVGKAGTGKTLLAIAAGLEAIMSQNSEAETYTRVLVARPVQPMGKDIGYLPGDVGDKLAPWMRPIFDNLDFLFRKNRGAEHHSWEQLVDQNLLHIEPLTYIRGRTIPQQYIVIDEAQNLSPHEVKTIVTRVGEGTKIVLTGDCEQIDSPYLDSVNNGLAYVVERLKGESLIGHITLNIGERSELSELASKLL